MGDRDRNTGFGKRFAGDGIENRARKSIETPVCTSDLHSVIHRCCSAGGFPSLHVEPTSSLVPVRPRISTIDSRPHRRNHHRYRERLLNTAKQKDSVAHRCLVFIGPLLRLPPLLVRPE